MAELRAKEDWSRKIQWNLPDWASDWPGTKHPSFCLVSPFEQGCPSYACPTTALESHDPSSFTGSLWRGPCQEDSPQRLVEMGPRTAEMMLEGADLLGPLE